MTRFHFPIAAAFLIIAAMLLASCAQTSDYSFSGGKGTVRDPFQIASAQDLLDLSEMVNTTNESHHYRLTADIDMAGHLWTPIGRRLHDGSVPTSDFHKNRMFRGTLNGGGHVIKNLTIHTAQKRDREEYPTSTNMQAAFIGFAAGSQNSPTVIKDLTLENIYISVESLDYNETNISSFIGVAGTAQMRGVQIENCHVTGTVRGGRGSSRIAGFAGESCGTITGCSFEGVLEYASSDWRSPAIGGFIASNAGRIENCRSGSLIMISAAHSGSNDTPAIHVDGFAAENHDPQPPNRKLVSIQNSSANGAALAHHDAIEMSFQKSGFYDTANITYDMASIGWSESSRVSEVFQGGANLRFLKGGVFSELSGNDDASEHFMKQINNALFGSYGVRYLIMHGTQHLEIYLSQTLAEEDTARIKQLVKICYEEAPTSSGGKDGCRIMIIHGGEIESFEAGPDR